MIDVDDLGNGSPTSGNAGGVGGPGQEEGIRPGAAYAADPNPSEGDPREAHPGQMPNTEGTIVDQRYNDQPNERVRPGSGGMHPETGGSHGAASDGISGYRGAAEANVENEVSGNPDKTTYSGTTEGSGTPTNPSLYRDPSVDPAAKIEAAQNAGASNAAESAPGLSSAGPATGASPSVTPSSEGAAEGIHGRTDSPGRIDPAQKMTDTQGVAPATTVDPTVGLGSPNDPIGSSRML